MFPNLFYARQESKTLLIFDAMKKAPRKFHKIQ